MPWRPTACSTCVRSSAARSGNVARYLWHVIWKSHLRLADANLSRSRSLRIEAADGADVAYQVDGDFGGTLPVDVDVLAGDSCGCW